LAHRLSCAIAPARWLLGDSDPGFAEAQVQVLVFGLLGWPWCAVFLFVVELELRPFVSLPFWLLTPLPPLHCPPMALVGLVSLDPSWKVFSGPWFSKAQGAWWQAAVQKCQ
jgi:hypothetical protein